MLDRKRSAIFLMITGLLLLLAGCDKPEMPWTITWTPSNVAAQTISPQLAYAAHAYAQQSGEGALLHPAKNVWLATGSNPKIGLALSQLDAAGQFFAVGVITVDPGSNWWTLTDSGSIDRPAPGSGVPASREESKAWTLPAGTYRSIALDVPDTPPGGSVQLWVSDDNQEFVLARLYAAVQPPAAHINVTLAGQPGWLFTQDGFTIIGLVLETGIYQGLGTLLFAGTTGVQQSENLATQAATNLNDLLPS